MKFLQKTIFLLFIPFLANAQITLEAIDPGFIFKVAQDDYIYVKLNQANNTLDLHDFNHSLIKSVSLPNNVYAQSIYQFSFFSRKLFDCDSSNIEFMALVNDTTLAFPYQNSLMVIREDGSVLLDLDSISAAAAFSWDGVRHFIHNTSNGAKMLVYSQNRQRSELYALCGTLPISYKVQEIPFIKGSYPNPAKESIEIEYSLPSTASTGKLTITDLKGQLIKEYTVNHNFSSIIVNTANINSGTYIYTIEADDGSRTSDKFIKVK